MHKVSVVEQNEGLSTAAHVEALRERVGKKGGTAERPGLSKQAQMPCAQAPGVEGQPGGGSSGARANQGARPDHARVSSLDPSPCV